MMRNHAILIALWESTGDDVRRREIHSFINSQQGIPFSSYGHTGDRMNDS